MTEKHLILVLVAAAFGLSIIFSIGLIITIPLLVLILYVGKGL